MTDSHQNPSPQRLFVKTPSRRDDDEDFGSCASRPSPTWLPAFHAKCGKDGTRSFDYSHMGLKFFDASGTIFMLEFHEPASWSLTVYGRNLWTIYNYLVLHKLEWIEQADRDFADHTHPIITRISIEPIQATEDARRLPESRQSSADREDSAASTS